MKKTKIVVCAQIPTFERYIEEEQNVTRARSIQLVFKIGKKKTMNPTHDRL